MGIGSDRFTSLAHTDSCQLVESNDWASWSVL